MLYFIELLWALLPNKWLSEIAECLDINGQCVTLGHVQCDTLNHVQLDVNLLYVFWAGVWARVILTWQFACHAWRTDCCVLRQVSKLVVLTQSIWSIAKNKLHVRSVSDTFLIASGGLLLSTMPRNSSIPSFALLLALLASRLTTRPSPHVLSFASKRFLLEAPARAAFVLPSPPPAIS